MLVYVTRLWLAPLDDFREPVAVVTRWLSRKIGKQLTPELFMAGVERAFEGGHQVRSTASVDDYPHLLTIGYTHPDSDVNGRQWVTEIGLRQNSPGDDVECTIRVSTNEVSTRVTAAVQVSRPGVVNELVRRCKLSPRTQGVSTHVLNDQSADAFRHVVLDPTRTHSLVVLSTLPDGKFAADPKTLSSLLLGLADIVTIPSEADGFWLARIVGKDFVPYRGAVKLIYPIGRRFDAGMPPTRTFTASDAAALAAKGTRLQDELFSLIVHRSNLPLSRTHISLQLTRETRIRRDLVHRRAEAAKSGNLQEYSRFLEQYVAELEQERKDQAGSLDLLEKLVATQEDRERKLSFDNEALKQRLADAGRAGRPENSDDGPPAEVAAAVLAAVEHGPDPEQSLRIIEHLFAERVVLLPEAWRSARASQGFRHRAKLYDLLHLLATDYWEALAAGRPDAEARKVFGNSYAAQESEGVAGNSGARARRTFQYGSEAVEMMKHLKIGVKDSAAESIRVHFEWFPEDRRIVIGHCGEHLAFK